MTSAGARLRPSPGWVMAAGAFLALVVGMAATRPATPVGRSFPPATHVVVVGLPSLTMADVRVGPMPELRALAAAGTVGAMTARLAERVPTSAALYAALGAGSEAAMPAGFGATAPATTPLAGTGAPADDGAAAVAGQPAGGAGPVVMPLAVRGVAANRAAHRSSLPGALGDALAHAGVGAAAVGNSDSPGVGALARDNYRPGAAAVMTSDGRLDHAVTDRAAVLDRAPAAPGGLAANPAEVVRHTSEALASNRLVVVDPGDLDRLGTVDPPASHEQYARLRSDALARADATIGLLRRALPERTLLLVVGLDPGPTRRLSPVVATGPGIGMGELVSPSTGRTGLVTLADLGPTVLRALRVPVPSGMVGQPLRSASSRQPADLARLSSLDRDARAVERLRGPITDGLVFAVVLFGLFAMLELSGLGRPGRSGWLLRGAALAVAGVPLATLLAGFLPSDARPWSPVVLVVAAVAVPLTARALTSATLDALVVVEAATLAVVLVDLCTGSRLQTSTALGSSVLVAARFRGIGNAGLGSVAAASVILAASIVQRAGTSAGASGGANAIDQGRARRAVIVLFTAVTAVVCLPFLGAKVGGIFVLVPLLVGVGAALFGRALTWRLALVAGGAVVAVLAAAVVVDQIVPGTRSHLGRLAGTTAGEGADSLAVIVGRKLSSGVHVARTSHWMPAAIVLAVVVAAVLWRWDGWHRFAPSGSTWRVAVVGLLAAAGLGLVTSDSGILTAALVLVAAAPYVVLLDLNARRRATRAPFDA